MPSDHPVDCGKGNPRTIMVKEIQLRYFPTLGARGVSGLSLSQGVPRLDS